jgi:hypothetical protein
MRANTYNGWSNYQTWNAALWIGNEEWLYKAAVDFMQRYKGGAPYSRFIKQMGMQDEKTLDGTKWLSTRTNLSELNAMMRELVS